MTAPPSLRERRRAQTEQEIAAVAFRLAAERGYDEVTIEEISRAAGISPRTFFNYFASKERAILAVYPDPVETLFEELDRRPADEPPMQALRAALLKSTSLYDLSHEEMRSRTRLRIENPPLQMAFLGLSARFEDIIVEKLSARPPAAGLSAMHIPLMAAACISVLRVVTEYWSRDDTDTPMIESLAAAFDLIEAGFAMVAK